MKPHRRRPTPEWVEEPTVRLPHDDLRSGREPPRQQPAALFAAIGLIGAAVIVVIGMVMR